MTLLAYLIAAVSLLVAAWVVFRILVRRDYQRRGRLRPLVGFLRMGTLAACTWHSLPSTTRSTGGWSGSLTRRWGLCSR